jgi:hypothetical protein
MAAEAKRGAIRSPEAAVAQTTLILLAELAQTLLDADIVTRENLAAWLQGSETRLRQLESGISQSVGLTFVKQLRDILSIPGVP